MCNHVVDARPVAEAKLRNMDTAFGQVPIHGDAEHAHRHPDPQIRWRLSLKPPPGEPPTVLERPTQTVPLPTVSVCGCAEPSPPASVGRSHRLEPAVSV